MATEKRQLELILDAKNKMASGTQAAARDIEKVGTAADAAGRKTRLWERASKSAEDATDDLGETSRTAARGIGKLDREIDKVNNDLTELAFKMAAAGTAAERLDISKGIRKSQADLGRLTKSKGLLEKILPDPSEGRSLGRKLGDAIADGVTSAPKLGVAGGVIGAIMAPSLAAGLAGAVVGGIGLGGIIGGVALVAKDPAIQTQATAIGKSFSAGIQAEARGAFLTPVKDALTQVEGLATRSIPKIGKIFDSTAPHLNKFTANVIAGGEALLDSFVVAASKSGPPMDALGRIVKDTSENIGGFVTMLASHSEEGASALDDLNMALQNTIQVATIVVDALADIRGALDSLDDHIDHSREWLEDHVSWLDLTADGYQKNSVQAQEYRDHLIGVAGAAGTLTKHIKGAEDATTTLAESHDTAARAASGQRDALVDLSNELRAQADPAFALLSAQDKLRRGQEDLSAATKKYGSKSREAREATRNLASAALDLQGKAGALGSTFDGKLSPSMRNTLKAAKLTDAQIDAIADEFARAKRAGDKFARNYAARATLTTVYKTIRSSNNETSPSVGNAIRDRRASGGPTARGVPYLVGEHGPEIWMPNAAGRVLSAAATRGAVKTTGGTGGGGWPAGGLTVRVDLVGPEESRVWFRKMIRTMDVLPSVAA